MPRIQSEGANAMPPDVEMNNTQSDEVVVSVITVLLRTTRSPEVLKQAIETLRGECNDVAGFVSGEVLLSVDARRLAIVTEWRDVHAWGASRYDVRVGNMLEVCLANSTVLDFEVYRRRARFVAPGLNESGGKTSAT
jgi:hypothetical protein